MKRYSIIAVMVVAVMPGLAACHTTTRAPVVNHVVVHHVVHPAPPTVVHHVYVHQAPVPTRRGLVRRIIGRH